VSSQPGIDVGRFGRTLALIGAVTAVFLFLTANRLGGDLFRVGAVGIGVVAMITAMTGFLIAAAGAYDAE
jgi:ABC-type enterobactin transport system permease subunit